MINKTNKNNVPSKELLVKMIDSSSQMIALLDTEMSIIFANKSMMDTLEMEERDVYNTPYWDLPIWEHSNELKNKILFSMEKIFLGETINFQVTQNIKGLGLRDNVFTIEPIFDSFEEIEYLLVYSYDITQYKIAEVALQRTEKQLKTFFDYSTDGNIINTIEEPVHWKEYFDNGNENEILDYIIKNQKTRISNKEIHRQFKTIENKNTDFTKFLFSNKDEQKSFLKKLIQNKIIHFEKEFLDLDLILSCTYVAIFDSENRYYGHFGIHRDITESKKMERELIELATKDSLTGVNIRRHYINLATKAFSLLDDLSKLGVLMIDIDNFKGINDTFGHDAGDKALIKMARLCEDVIGNDGIFGRMGGEEFSAIICYDSNRENALKIAEKIRIAVENLVVPLDNLSIFFTISIGISFSESAKSFESLLKEADRNLYKAKHTGKNKVVYK